MFSGRQIIKDHFGSTGKKSLNTATKIIDIYIKPISTGLLIKKAKLKDAVSPNCSAIQVRAIEII